ncbi:hypothetical protein [Rickettsiella endosymbiont of Miltochrista miniata]|uniref:hypothetical protein n=1 Tax=Rickettsiella endosymbiont of Miltochrista miniata TaxID=3066239 RepID=UPI00313C550A
MLKPLSFLKVEELNCLQERLPNPQSPRFATLFLIDKQKDTYFLLDIAALSEETAQKHKLFFEKTTINNDSTSLTVSEIRQAYHKNDLDLLDQLRINRAIAQALEIIGKDLSVENLSKMEDALTCNISHAPYIFPMLTPHGHTYELTYLKRILEDPLAHQPCFASQLTPNKAADQLIQLMYQYANTDTQKARIDYLKVAKKEILDELDGLVVSADELPTEAAVVQEKEKLIKKRDTFSMLTSGRGPVLVHMGMILLMLPVMAVPFNYYLSAAENRISTLPRAEGLGAQLDTMRIMLALLLGLIGLITAAGTITFTFSGNVNTYLHRREKSLNEQIGRLSDWINDSESRQLQFNTLDRQIEALNKLLEPQKLPELSATPFFQNPRRRVRDSSSIELSVDERVCNSPAYAH